MHLNPWYFISFLAVVLLNRKSFSKFHSKQRRTMCFDEILYAYRAVVWFPTAFFKVHVSCPEVPIHQMKPTMQKWSRKRKRKPWSRKTHTAKFCCWISRKQGTVSMIMLCARRGWETFCWKRALSRFHLQLFKMSSDVRISFNKLNAKRSYLICKHHVFNIKLKSLLALTFFWFCSCLFFVLMLTNSSPKTIKTATVYDAINRWNLEGVAYDKRQLPTLNSIVDLRWKDSYDGKLLAWTLPEDEPLNSSLYGDMGRPVQVPKRLQQEAKSKQKLHQLNVVASDLVGYRRRLPDMRHSR